MGGQGSDRLMDVRRQYLDDLNKHGGAALAEAEDSAVRKVLSGSAINKEIRKVQTRMAATILGVRPPGRLDRYELDKLDREYPVYRKVWKDNNRYDARGKLR